MSCRLPVPLLCALLLAPACRRPASIDRPLQVAAAADLQRAFGDLQAAFTARTGRALRISFGSSGLLMRQIAEGAPFDLFAAASGAFLDPLLRQDRIVPGSRARYASGRLCLWTPPDGPALAALADLGRPEIRRVSLANPEHAPYGQAAVTALRRAGLYDGLRPRLVYGENVRQALQYAETGHVEAALVACSLLTPDAGHRAEVPPALSGPVDQVLGVVRGGDEAGAAALASFVLSPDGQAILRRHGFGLPQPPGPAR